MLTLLYVEEEVDVVTSVKSISDSLVSILESWLYPGRGATVTLP